VKKEKEEEIYLHACFRLSKNTLLMFQYFAHLPTIQSFAYVDTPTCLIEKTLRKALAQKICSRIRWRIDIRKSLMNLSYSTLQECEQELFEGMILGEQTLFSQQYD
jgi:hypothetical protein